MPPSGPRPTARPGAGPGRGKPRARPQTRERTGSGDPANEPTVAFEVGTPDVDAPSGKGASRAAAGPQAPAAAPATATRKGSGSGRPSAATATRASRAGAVVGRRSASVLHRAVRANLTARALALVVVVLVLTISYATSLRIYFSQAHEIATTKAQIADSQAAIGDLQVQIARWNDPAYVAAQARERLGWLMPGETGYTVVGADGKPLGGGLTLDSPETTDPGQQQRMWWDRMWGSVAAADKPVKAKANPGDRAPVTPDSKPR